MIGKKKKIILSRTDVTVIKNPKTKTLVYLAFDESQQFLWFYLLCGYFLHPLNSRVDLAKNTWACQRSGNFKLHDSLDRIE